MDWRPISETTGLPLFRLQQDRLGAAGLGSYIASLRQHLTPFVVGGYPQLTELQQLNIFSSALQMWFKQERLILSPDSPTLLQLLVQLGYLDLEREFSLDYHRITGVDKHD